MRTKRLAELALLAAIALTVFTVELRIPNPFPIPGIKLGLANIITVYALYHYRAGEVLMVLLTRIFLGALFAGSMVSLLYSLAGGMFCMAGMLPLHHVIPEQGIWFASVIGAVLRNAGQIAVAILVTGTVGIIAYFPVLLVSGCLAGLFTGLCAQAVIRGLGPILQAKRC